jgi:hypothetical protein
MYAVSMTAKARLSATVDGDLIAASQAAVAAGEAESVSAWVNDALRLKIEHDRRLRGIDDFIAAYEAEYGEITDEEMDAAYRAARARAIVVRGGEIAGTGRGGAA